MFYGLSIHFGRPGQYVRVVKTVQGKTGAITRDVTSIKVKLIVKLPSETRRKFRSQFGYANIDLNSAFFAIEKANISLTPVIGDYILFDDIRYDIEAFEYYDEWKTWLFAATQPKGNLPRKILDVNVSESIKLTEGV